MSHDARLAAHLPAREMRHFSNLRSSMKAGQVTYVISGLAAMCVVLAMLWAY
jgi:hypothetical protein